VTARTVVALLLVAVAAPPSRWAREAGTSVRSKHGLYRVTVVPLPAQSPVGRLHTWRLTLRKAHGGLVSHAKIAVDGDMPEHGHGLPTQPRVRELGRGRYLVGGMKFQMGGAWYVEFAIKARPGRDVARFEFVLPQS
jgi:YtkA-like